MPWVTRVAVTLETVLITQIYQHADSARAQAEILVECLTSIRFGDCKQASASNRCLYIGWCREVGSGHAVELSASLDVDRLRINAHHVFMSGYECICRHRLHGGGIGAMNRPQKFWFLTTFCNSKMIRFCRFNFNASKLHTLAFWRNWNTQAWKENKRRSWKRGENEKIKKTKKIGKKERKYKERNERKMGKFENRERPLAVISQTRLHINVWASVSS